MSTEQAYINGFVKRANEYGLTDNQAIELLKSAESSWLGKMKERKVTDEDIERMREHQKDNSFKSEFIPFKNMIDAYKAGKQPELAKQSAEQAPYGGVKTLGEMWNEFKTKTPTLATKQPVSKGAPLIDPRLAKKGTAADAPVPAKIHSKPITIPSPPPVRSFGMTSNQMQNAEDTLNRGEELNLAAK